MAIHIDDLVKIIFKDATDAGITRVDDGVACICLIGSDKEQAAGTIANLTAITELPADYSADHVSIITAALKGGANKLMIVPVAAYDTVAFTKLENLIFDYIAFPDAETTEATAIADWVKSYNENANHRFSAVLANTPADDMHVINFTHPSVTIAGKTLTTAQATGYVAAAIAAVTPEQSITYQVTAADLATDMSKTDIDAASDAGKVVLFNDGHNIRFASGVNSLTTLTDDQDESFQSIKVVSIMDLFYNAVKAAILDKYIGKYANTYQNKLLLVGEIYGLLAEMERQGLVEQGDTSCEIDLEAQTAYLRSIGYKSKDGRGVDELSDDEILRANTRKKVFIKCRMIPIDAIESVEITVAA